MLFYHFIVFSVNFCALENITSLHNGGVSANGSRVPSSDFFTHTRGLKSSTIKMNNSRGTYQIIAEGTIKWNC